MEKKKVIVFIVISIVGVNISGWSPWITKVQAYNLVIEKLGGPDELYYYLREMIILKDIQKTFIKFPFTSLVHL